MRGTQSSQQIAETCGFRIYKLDQMAQTLGIVLDEMEPGRSRLSMTVREDMVNGFGMCHGGMIFSLADCAFAYSCNSRNRKTVAAGATIEFIRASKLGDRLTAVAEERSLVGRTGIYDIRVVNQNGELVALFRGRSHCVAGATFPELEESVDPEGSPAPEPAQQSRKR
jgi:acyl-CoA thioesterase